MSKKSKKTDQPVLIGPDRWSYTQLAAHLTVSVRTLKRYVRAGSIPQPTLIGTRSWWHGESLVAARSGMQLPGTFDYAPNSREAARAGTISRKAAVRAKGKKVAAARRVQAKRALRDTSGTTPSGKGGAV